MQFMFVGHIIDHDCRVILDPDFSYIQNSRTGHLVITGPRHHDSHRIWELDWLHLPSDVPVSLISSAFVASSTSSFA
jgi:hypothetical protein